MSDQKPIIRAALARHWKVSPSYVSKLAREKGMPDFLTLAAADEWRALYAPPVAVREIARSSPTPPTTVASSAPALPSAPASETPSGDDGRRHRPPTPGTLEAIEPHQLDAFCVIEGTFEETMIKRARRNALIAGGMCERAFAAGSVQHVAAWGDRFNDQAETARKLTLAYLELQEKAGVLVPIDIVMDVIGTELQQVRSSLLKFGERLAARLNPADPLTAKTVLDAAIDDVFRQLEHVENLSREEMRAS